MTCGVNLGVCPSSVHEHKHRGKEQGTRLQKELILVLLSQTRSDTTREPRMESGQKMELPLLGVWECHSYSLLSLDFEQPDSEQQNSELVIGPDPSAQET